MLRKNSIIGASSQSMVKADYTLNLRVSVGNQRQTRRQKRLLCSKYLQIIRCAMFHQQTSIMYSNRQIFYLLTIQHNFFPGILPLIQRIVYFTSRIK